jgi:hypothetical protein
LAFAAIFLGACSAKQEPVEVVQAFVTALQTFDIETAESMVCESQRSNIRSTLEPFEDVSQLDGIGLGEAFEMSLTDVSFQELSNDGEAAVVAVRGTLMLSFLGQQEQQGVDEVHVVIKEHGRWVVCDP